MTVALDGFLTYSVPSRIEKRDLKLFLFHLALHYWERQNLAHLVH